MKFVPIVLAGGIGERLYPLSVPEFPKQFSVTYDGKSLFQHTVERIRDNFNTEPIVVVRNNYQATIAKVQAEKIGISITLAIEDKECSNTSNAIRVGIQKAKVSGLESDVYVVFPADHYIGDFKQILKLLKNYQHGTLSSVVIKGSYIHPQYGNIIKIKDSFKFYEKPKSDIIHDETIHICWNTGIYVGSENVLIEVTGSDYNIDYNVQDKVNSGKIIYRPLVYEGEWKDLGTWKELIEFLLSREDKRVIKLDKSGLSYGYDENGNPIAFDVLDLVECEGGLHFNPIALVKANNVTAIIDLVRNKPITQESEPKYPIYREWGYFKVVHESSNYKVKELTILPGRSLSMQRHFHRSEHWIVHQGVAKVIKNGKEYYLYEGQSTFIPVGSWHQLSNPGKLTLKVVEIQRGDYLEEDDIERR